MKKIVFSALAALMIGASGTQAATLLADGTFSAPNDLTRVQEGSTVYEFLELPNTLGMTAAVAQSTFSADGFVFAGFSHVKHLLEAFGFSGVTLPALGTYQTLGAGDAAGFAERLYSAHPTRSYIQAGFQNDLGHPVYICISGSGSCGLDSGEIVNFPYLVDGNPNSNVLMVREAAVAPVPLPATALLLAGALAGFGALRRWGGASQ